MNIRLLYVNIKEDGSSFHTGYKNVHIDLSKFGDWIKVNRQNLLDELLK